jgi:hypothetical protein
MLANMPETAILGRDEVFRRHNRQFTFRFDFAAEGAYSVLAG